MLQNTKLIYKGQLLSYMPAMNSGNLKFIKISFMVSPTNKEKNILKGVYLTKLYNRICSIVYNR